MFGINFYISFRIYFNYLRGQFNLLTNDNHENFINIQFVIYKMDENSYESQIDQIALIIKKWENKRGNLILN